MFVVLHQVTLRHDDWTDRMHALMPNTGPAKTKFKEGVVISTASARHQDNRLQLDHLEPLLVNWM